MCPGQALKRTLNRFGRMETSADKLTICSILVYFGRGLISFVLGIIQTDLTHIKKRESEGLRLLDVYFFLSISTTIAPTIAIAAIMPADIGRKYCSDSVTGVCVGSGVAAETASATLMAVTACEGQ
jgi:hypothetical protein